MIVTDASVVATALVDDGPHGDSVRVRLGLQDLSAPELLDLEVTAVLRRLAMHGRIARQRAELALADLAVIPIRREPHLPLLSRCWQLRDNLTIYDASYVALAETLEVPLLTADVRLSNAPGTRCRIELLESPR